MMLNDDVKYKINEVWTMTIKMTEVFLSYLEVTSFMQNPFGKFSKELLITWLVVSVIQNRNYLIFLAESMFY